MYQSRLHASNGIVSLAIDALSGELLELINESSGDNLVKSHHPAAYTPFFLEIYQGQHKLPALPPRYLDIQSRPELKPEIQVVQEPDSARISMQYPAVCIPQGVLPIKVLIEIELPAGECRSLWRISISHSQPDMEVQRALFPVISGVWLGEDWHDDTLVLPKFAGERFKNPVGQLAAAPSCVHWKWQEYRYVYPLGGPYGEKDGRGCYVRELSYSGSASMLWADLFDEQEGTGLYLTCRNENLVMKAIRAESFGEAEPGLSLSIVHYPCLKGGSWESDVCVVALHPGDWHWAADDYRTFRTSITRPNAKGHRPIWFENSPGLVAHYDFQYQGGGIVHRYADIPALYEKARKLGMPHLLLSGWHEGGFDNGFPRYRINPALGTEQELIDAVAKVRAAGGHVAFYINSRLCNLAYPELADLVENSTVMRRDGKLHIEKYGAADISFASLCNQDPAWRDVFVGVVRYLTQTIGADSMYLDQLGMAPSLLCYHPGHAEHAGNPAGWNQGYEAMLERMRSDYAPEGMALLYEGCNDIFGPGVSGQLISTMFHDHSGAYPELYKYTFPEQILVDMMNPQRNSGMRAEHVARRSTKLMYRAFVTGSYLWVYDLEFDNTWDRDPKQSERLRRQNALRSAWIMAYGHGRFTDVVGLGPCTPELMVKRFELAQGILLAYANEKRVTGTLSVEWPFDRVPQVVKRTMEAPATEQAVSFTLEKHSGRMYAVMEAPASELAVVVLR